MESKRLHRWWLGACLTALLLANVVGGFSVVVTVVFVIIYLTGATLIRDDGDSPPAPVEDVQAEFDEDTAEPEAEAEDAVAAESPAESPEAEPSGAGQESTDDGLVDTGHAER